MSFGVLTLATPNDYLKAIGLALSLKVSNPGVPVAVACCKRIQPQLAPFFDFVIDENPKLRGFEHKVYLDQYSPFDETLFLDSDVLVFKPLAPYIHLWKGAPYTACGYYVEEGKSCFGLDRKEALTVIGKSRFVKIEGVGSGYFTKGTCEEFFNTARLVTTNYSHYAGQAKYADEDAVSIAMTMLDLPPVEFGDFFARYCSAKPGSLKMEAAKGLCQFKAATTGEDFAPCMMHFAANEAPVPYTRELIHIFRHFDVPTAGLIRLCVDDLYNWHIKAKLHKIKKKLQGRIKSST